MVNLMVPNRSLYLKPPPPLRSNSIEYTTPRFSIGARHHSVAFYIFLDFSSSLVAISIFLLASILP